MRCADRLCACFGRSRVLDLSSRERSAQRRANRTLVTTLSLRRGDDRLLADRPDSSSRFLDSFIELVEGLGNAEHILEVIDLERLVKDRVERERPSVALWAKRIRGVAVRGDESRAIDLNPAILANETELHGEPEQPRHARRVLFVVGGGRNLSVALEKIGEARIGVQRDVAKDVVEDVRLRQIVELFALSYRHRRRKLSQRQALKKALGRDVP